MSPADYTRRARPGIRAHLLDVGNKRLEMDFVIVSAAYSFHVLNAVSPGFACATPFEEQALGEIGKRPP